MLAVLRRQRNWLWPLVLLIPGILFADRLSHWYYEKVERPRLLTEVDRGKPCSEFSSHLPNKAPRSCDLAYGKTKPDGTVVEYFHFADGSRLSLASSNGRWKGTSAECATSSRLGDVAWLGVALLGVAFGSHAVRTKQWVYFFGKLSEPMNALETVFALYGASVFSSKMVALAGASCTAMASI